MVRQPRRRDIDNNDRWLVSYADLLTLLFAFFVVMYAISSVNEGKYRVFSASLTSAFGTQVGSPEILTPANEQEVLLRSLVDRRDAKLGEQQRKQQERMQAIAQNLNTVMTSLVKDGQVSVTQTQRGVEVEINASALFGPGDAVLRGGSIKTLAEVAQVLKLSEQAIEVEGHSDNVPINTPRYPSNWELSSARASSVVRLFVEHGVAAGHLTAVGSAANRPMVSNGTAEGRARNRRVTVTVLAPAAERLSGEVEERGLVAEPTPGLP